MQVQIQIARRDNRIGFPSLIMLERHAMCFSGIHFNGISFDEYTQEIILLPSSLCLWYSILRLSSSTHGASSSVCIWKSPRCSSISSEMPLSHCSFKEISSWQRERGTASPTPLLPRQNSWPQQQPTPARHVLPHVMWVCGTVEQSHLRLGTRGQTGVQGLGSFRRGWGGQ